MPEEVSVNLDSASLENDVRRLLSDLGIQRHKRLRTCGGRRSSFWPWALLHSWRWLSWHSRHPERLPGRCRWTRGLTVGDVRGLLHRRRYGA